MLKHYVDRGGRGEVDWRKGRAPPLKGGADLEVVVGAELAFIEGGRKAKGPLERDMGTMGGRGEGGQGGIGGCYVGSAGEVEIGRCRKKEKIGERGELASSAEKNKGRRKENEVVKT